MAPTSSISSTQKSLFQCSHCGKRLNTAQGLKSHSTRLHPADHVRSSVQQDRPYSQTSSVPEEENDAFVDRLPFWKQSVTVMKRIPKAARQMAAESLSACIDRCVRENSRATWFKLFSFAFCVFELPSSPWKAKERSVSLATLVKRNITNFDTGNTFPNPTNRSIKQTNNREDLMRKQIEAKIRDGDIRGAVRVLSSEDSMATPVAETISRLRNKHPPQRENIEPSLPATLTETNIPASVATPEILKAVQSFPNGSAGGLDGLRPQHLKDMLGQTHIETTNKLAQSLADLVDLMLKGGVEKEVCKYLYGANLTALKKKDGEIRPIAVGNTIRRIAAKVISNRVQEPMGNLLRPIQLGYGTKGGAEAAVHATRYFLNNKPDPCQALLKLDFRNAFNSIHRDRLLPALKQTIPQYYNYFCQSYGERTKLLYQDQYINSERSVQQGDPLGPLAFCALLQPLCLTLKSELNMWYLDDGTLGGNPESVIQDLIKVIEWEEEYGLELNYTKCDLYVCSGSDEEKYEVIRRFHEVSPDIHIIEKESLCLLGAPLTDEALPIALDNRKNSICRLTSRLEVLQSHHALYLLQNCLGIPKLIYILRTSPAWKRPDKLHEIDEYMRTALQKITNSVMDEVPWKQATLPVNKGGLGIRLTEELALPAFLASVHSVSHLTTTIVPRFEITESTEAALRNWREKTSSEPPPNTHHHKQKEWDKPVIKQHYSRLCETFKEDQMSSARIKAVSSKEAGAWLNALPSPTTGNFLDNDSLRISVALRLGTTVCHQHECICGAIVEKWGHHGLRCKKSTGRHSRHGAINDVICRALISAGVPSKREPLGISRQDGKRPDGATLVPWKEGRNLVWDATCVDTLANSYLPSTSITQGSAATGAELKKSEKYRHLDGQYIFFPLGFETFGPWGPSAKKLISEIGSRLRQKTGEKRSKEFLRQRISIEIQRGNAIAVMGTIPHHNGLDEVYCLL